MRSFFAIQFLFGVSFTLGLGIDPAYEADPINYSATEPDTRLTRIEKRLKQGEKLLQGGTDQELLRELLDLLEVPVASQVLVYSKTSAQNSLISPQHPRAIYFSDNAYVGWVQHGDIEVITFDQNLGMVFHLVKLRSEQGGISFVRDRTCLNCHGAGFTDHWPGLMVRSVYPRADGHPIYQAGTFRTDYRSPLSERWGGWYVTGNSGDAAHLGNIIAREEENSAKVSYQSLTVKPVQTLEGLFPTRAYLNGGISDIVALMVLEHQVAAHNALVEGSLVTRQTLHRHQQMRRAFNEPIDAPLSETNQRIIAARADRITRVLLYADEHHLFQGGVEGAPAFQEAFARNARKNGDHRSLKDFRLYERLFKYRGSYLIYSEAFENLPPILKEAVLENMRGILVAGQGGADFAYLSDSEKQHLRSILEETLPDW